MITSQPHALTTAAALTLAAALAVASDVPPPSQGDLCALLTAEEAEAIVGGPLASPEAKPGGDCWYPIEAGGIGGGEIMLHLLPRQFGTKEEFHSFLVGENDRANARLKQAMARAGAEAGVKETAVEPVTDVGEPAYFVEPSLFALKKGKVLGIVAPDRSKAVQVATKAVPRF
jgi:hypothetical protein